MVGMYPSRRMAPEFPECLFEVYFAIRLLHISFENWLLS